MAAEECIKTRWWLPGKKFGLMMRMTNDPLSLAFFNVHKGSGQ